MIIVISGPGGVGKGTIVARLVESDPRLWLSRSWTTRERRPGEAEDAYVFATREDFERKIAEDGFLEWVEFLDYLQGSPVPEASEEHDILFEIDVHGARAILDRFPDALSFFVDAPSREHQEERLRGRGDAEHRIQQRLDKAREEASVAEELGCVVVINDDLDAAIEEIESLIASRR